MSLSRRLVLAAPLSLAAPRLARAATPLRFVPQADLAVLDPVWTSAYVTRNHALMVFDTLYGMDAEYRIRPQMVAGDSVEADGLTWRLTLREGLRFHDGAPVLARDCVASIRRWGARDGLGQSLLAATASLEAADDRSIVFRLKEKFPLLRYALGKPGSPVCVIMPERLAQTDPFQQVREMVGSGPFRFLAEERLAGARVAYARNEAYQPRQEPPSFTAGGKRASIERIEWQVLPDPATAASALRAGEVDWWEAPTFDQLPLLARDRQIRVAVMERTGFIGCMRLNHRQPPFDNPAVRRAILPALAQSDFMQASAGDAPDSWHGGVGFFCPGTPMASDAGMAALTGPRDLAAAKRALAEAGYTGQRIVVLAPTDLPTLKALADVAADLLQRIGFNVDYQALDWGSTLSRINRPEPVEQGGWSVFCTFWSGLDQLDPAVNASIRANGQGRGWPQSPALEALRDQWMRSGEEAEQKTLAAEMQRQAFEDLPYLPLGQLMARTAYRGSRLSDPQPGFPTFWGIETR
ncbi:ABC transporter substrate-binding protein [Roseomonas sp. 18066]|uniref:ABC transporter substrate-binding protein n=1 Tax=Roseomonas sp. 18066 TaxID=2681412 RepID=UPI00135726E9|nr:ABC transporter substrate-binding protein [Roseomonas sp. 18066]